LRLSNPGARTTALPLDKKAEVEELAKLAQAWWRSGTAVDDELRKVHVATLPVGLFDFFPSYWFLVQMPASPDPESLYMKALHVAARRRSVRLSLSMPDGDMAIVVAEALAAIPNCFPYSADTNHLKGGDRLGERFSRDLRPEHAGRIQVPGDCEDGAAEICTLAHALRTQAFKSPIVQAAQRVLRRYIVGQHFSAVRLGYSPGLEGYSTGGQLYAHSHVILLPVEHVARALRGGVTCVWGSEPRGVRGAELPVLCADGISLFGASPKEKHPCCTKPIVKSDLLRHYSPIGLDYYMFSSSFYLTAGQVETATGTPVRELVYRNGDKYGASFADILEGKYTLEPSTTFTARGEQLAQACTAYLTPVLPYRESAPPDTTKLVEVLGAKLAESQPATFVDTFFVQLIDFGDDKVLGGVKRQCGDYAVSVIVDSFAEGCACAQVFLAWG
jgi:hypothetical protein